MKLFTHFENTYPLKDGAKLIVTGTAYCWPSVDKMDFHERYDFDIDFVYYEGKDIKPVLEVTGGMADIEEHIFRTIASLFEKEKEVA